MSDEDEKKNDAAPTGEEKPARFTEASLKARGFKVPPPRGEGFTIVPIGTGKPVKRDDKA
jgi:hypothetical protein